MFEVIKPLRPLAYRNPLASYPKGKKKLPPRKNRSRDGAKDKLISVRLRVGSLEGPENKIFTMPFLWGYPGGAGTGAIYFIFIVQNFYLVDRTLAQMRTYTETW